MIALKVVWMVKHDDSKMMKMIEMKMRLLKTVMFLLENEVCCLCEVSSRS